MLDWARLGKGRRSSAPLGPTKQDNPGIALALGGGAARGWAHIGVLRALDEAGIRVNMIAGTSVGALVGGCYLAGRLNELEEFARGLTLRRMFGYFDFSLRGHGILGGMRLDAKLRSHLEGVMLEDLPCPMVCVATEIGTGHEFWLSSGHLVTAMRASYALPGVFEPVMCNGRMLIDGAMVNPVPVSVCRAYERHLVVAVNLHYDCFGRSAIIKHHVSDAATSPMSPAAQGERSRRLGITGVMVEAFSIIQDRITRSRLAGDPPDLSLQPRLSHIGLSEFHRADEAIRIGYETTRAQLPEIERLYAILS